MEIFALPLIFLESRFLRVQLFDTASRGISYIQTRERYLGDIRVIDRKACTVRQILPTLPHQQCPPEGQILAMITGVCVGERWMCDSHSQGD